MRRLRGMAAVLCAVLAAVGLCTQAVAETLERVRGLMTHHGFSLANPNRVLSLIGGFTANLLGYSASLPWVRAEVNADIVTMPLASASMTNNDPAAVASGRLELASVSVLPAPVASSTVVPV